MSLNLNFEHIDPGYSSLGTLFFNNDLQNYTISAKSSLLKNRLNLNGNVGIQLNNLTGNKLHSSTRFVGMINASALIGTKINLNLSYSNFNNTSILRAVDPGIPDIELSDRTLAQVNQNATLNLVYFLNQDRNQSLNGTYSFQHAMSIENEQVLPDQFSTFHVVNIQYSNTNTKKGLQIQTGVMGNFGYVGHNELINIAPTLGISLALLEKKLRLSTRFSYTLGYNNQIINNNVALGQFGINYQITKKQSMVFSSRWTKRFKTSVPEGHSELNSFSELSGSLGYNVSF